ncbi:hypothetical protein SAMN05216410_1132 [Sanguibacter gelidistatuariae]|uniref:DUF2087 domain-containing protein n=2 Tax=Sanguibacter gelidistatuariae TaxID=1814289 RepID=A0A1G6HN29_9MICO|nr:hypothetical protein SAMN05216410_1132 [Sanguibacter gelidistatuariae]
MTCMAHDWRPILAALADERTLAVYAQVVLAAPPVTATHLTSLDLRALRRLVATGLVVEDGERFRARPAVYSEALASAAQVDRGTAGSADGPERFLSDGKLLNLPRKRSDREDVVRLLAGRVLARSERVSEGELMLRLGELASDPVGLRRAMVDAGFISRTPNGSEYWST